MHGTVRHLGQFSFPTLPTTPSQTTFSLPGGAGQTQLFPPTQPTAATETRANLKVVRLDRDDRPGVPNVRIQVFAIFTAASPQKLGEGLTDSQGRITFIISTQVAPPPQRYRFEVDSGLVSISFPSQSVEVVFGTTTSPVIAICPAGTDPLICEISEKQLGVAQELSVLNQQWGGLSRFTLDIAHASLSNSGPQDPRLTQSPLSWTEDVSWGLMDFAIPLQEWDTVLRKRAGTFNIFNEIPFPLIAGKDWFSR